MKRKQKPSLQRINSFNQILPLLSGAEKEVQHINPIVIKISVAGKEKRRRNREKSDNSTLEKSPRKNETYESAKKMNESKEMNDKPGDLMPIVSSVELQKPVRRLNKLKQKLANSEFKIEICEPAT